MLLFDEHSEELDIFLRKKKERKYTLCTLGRTVEEPQFDVGHVCKCNAFWQWSYATVILSSSWIRAMNTHTHTHTHTHRYTTSTVPPMESHTRSETQENT